jgi:hypothetical protein
LLDKKCNVSSKKKVNKPELSDDSDNSNDPSINSDYGGSDFSE